MHIKQVLLVTKLVFFFINKYYSPPSVDLPVHLQSVLAVGSCFLALCRFLELWNWNLAVKVPLL